MDSFGNKEKLFEPNKTRLLKGTLFQTWKMDSFGNKENLFVSLNTAQLSGA